MKKDLNNEKLGEKMGLLGRGRGYLGLPKRFNRNLNIIWFIFGASSVYFLSQKNVTLAIVSIGLGIIFTYFEIATE